MKRLYTIALFMATVATAAAYTPTGHTDPVTATITSRTVTAGPAKARTSAPTATDHRWEALGTGRYTDDILPGLFPSFNPTTYEVTVERDAAHEGYYRVEGFVTNHPDYRLLYEYTFVDESIRYLVIDATDPQNVIIEPSDIGLTEGSGEELHVYSFSWLARQGEVSEDAVTRAGFRGTLADGIISFTGKGALWMATPTADAAGKGFSANPNGEFRLILPDAKDYSIEMMCDSWCAYDGKSIVTAWAGSDVASLLAGTVTDLSSEDRLAAILANPVQLVSGQSAIVPAPADVRPGGLYTVLVLALDDEGRLRNMAIFDQYAPDTSTDWKPLSHPSRFNDYMVSHAYGFTTAPYEVAVEESTTTPGLYRLVNPYAAMRNNVLETSAHGNHNHYLYFDASDPDCVVLLESPTGYISETDGDSRVWSLAARLIKQGESKESVKSATRGGILRDGVITFPVSAYIYISFLAEGNEFMMNVNFSESGGNYSDGPMYIDLSDSLAAGDIEADGDEQVEYYNLQGMRVAAPTPGRLIIRRTATSATKIIY